MLGGVITTFVSWQYIFFINIPIGIIAAAIGFKYIKDTQKTASKLNLPGMGLLAVALVLLSLGLVNFAAEGISTSSIILALIGAALIPVFFWYDHGLKNSLIDYEALKNRILRNAILSAFFPKHRLLCRCVHGNYVFAGHKRALAVERFVAVGARVRGGQFSGSNHGQTQRQVRFKRHSHHRSILLSPRHPCLLDYEHNLAALDCASSLSRFRLRNLHVLPSQQQRRHGKRTPRLIRQHLRLA